MPDIRTPAIGEPEVAPLLSVRRARAGSGCGCVLTPACIRATQSVFRDDLAAWRQGRLAARAGVDMCTVAAMGCSYESRVSIAMEPGAAKNRVLEALNAMPRVHKVAAMPDAVTASVRLSWWSWGERIVINLDESPAGTEVDIRSRCWVPTTLIDWGKNERNVNRVLQGIGDSV